MRILRPTLIGLTLGLSVVSIYLATVLADERARTQHVAQQRREVTLRLERLTASQPKAGPAAVPATSATTPITATTTPAVSAPKDQEEDEQGGWSFASHTERLRQITNPTLRAAMLRQGREDQREAHPHLTHELRLSAADADELFTILAEQSLRHEERYHRNRIAGRREYIDDTQLDATAQEDLKALLGAQGFRALLDFRDGLPERRRIDTLTERLGRADAFTPSEASQLAQIMRAERATFEGELQRLPGNVRFRGGSPEDARLRGAEGLAQQQFNEGQVARIEAFHARIRERASAFLSPVQLQRLRQQQDERVAIVQTDYIWARYVAPAHRAMEEANEARQAK
jgi:hypothetical protein